MWWGVAWCWGPRILGLRAAFSGVQLCSGPHRERRLSQLTPPGLGSCRPGETSAESQAPCPKTSTAKIFVLKRKRIALMTRTASCHSVAQATSHSKEFRHCNNYEIIWKLKLKIQIISNEKFSWKAITLSKIKCKSQSCGVQYSNSWLYVVVLIIVNIN